MFENLLRIFSSERQPNIVVSHDKLDVPVPVKFKADIQTLTERYGVLCRGKRIVLSLQDALTYLPRDRKRVDAYRTLKNFLLEEFGVELVIESQKTKNYGSKIKND